MPAARSRHVRERVPERIRSKQNAQHRTSTQGARVRLQFRGTVATSLAAGCVVAMSVACAKGSEKAAAKPESTAAVAAPTAAAPAQPPGTLTKPIDQYTGDEFYAFTHQLQY